MYRRSRSEPLPLKRKRLNEDDAVPGPEVYAHRSNSEDDGVESMTSDVYQLVAEASEGLRHHATEEQEVLLSTGNGPQRSHSVPTSGDVRIHSLEATKENLQKSQLKLRRAREACMPETLVGLDDKAVYPPSRALRNQSEQCADAKKTFLATVWKVAGSQSQFERPDESSGGLSSPSTDTIPSDLVKPRSRVEMIQTERGVKRRTLVGPFLCEESDDEILVAQDSARANETCGKRWNYPPRICSSQRGSPFSNMHATVHRWADGKPGNLCDTNTADPAGEEREQLASLKRARETWLREHRQQSENQCVKRSRGLRQETYLARHTNEKIRRDASETKKRPIPTLTNSQSGERLSVPEVLLPCDNSQSWATTPYSFGAWSTNLHTNGSLRAEMKSPLPINEPDEGSGRIDKLGAKWDKAELSAALRLRGRRSNKGLFGFNASSRNVQDTLSPAKARSKASLSNNDPTTMAKRHYRGHNAVMKDAKNDGVRLDSPMPAKFVDPQHSECNDNTHRGSSPLNPEMWRMNSGVVDRQRMINRIWASLIESAHFWRSQAGCTSTKVRERARSDVLQLVEVFIPPVLQGYCVIGPRSRDIVDLKHSMLKRMKRAASSANQNRPPDSIECEALRAMVGPGSFQHVNKLLYLQRELRKSFSEECGVSSRRTAKRRTQLTNSATPPQASISSGELSKVSLEEKLFQLPVQKEAQSKAIVGPQQDLWQDGCTEDGDSAASTSEDIARQKKHLPPSRVSSRQEYDVARPIAARKAKASIPGSRYSQGTKGILAKPLQANAETEARDTHAAALKRPTAVKQISSRKRPLDVALQEVIRQECDDSSIARSDNKRRKRAAEKRSDEESELENTPIEVDKVEPIDDSTHSILYTILADYDGFPDVPDAESVILGSHTELQAAMRQMNRIITDIVASITRVFRQARVIWDIDDFQLSSQTVVLPTGGCCRIRIARSRIPVVQWPGQPRRMQSVKPSVLYVLHEAKTTSVALPRHDGGGASEPLIEREQDSHFSDFSLANQVAKSRLLACGRNSDDPSLHIADTIGELDRYIERIEHDRVCFDQTRSYYHKKSDKHTQSHLAPEDESDDVVEPNSDSGYLHDSDRDVQWVARKLTRKPKRHQQEHQLGDTEKVEVRIWIEEMPIDIDLLRDR